MRAIRIRLAHGAPAYETTGPIAMRSGGIVAKLLVGHRAMTLERTVGAAVIGDTGISGHARAGEDEGWALAEEFGGALEGLGRWRGNGGFRDDALDGADGRAVSHLHGFGEAGIVDVRGVRHRSPLCMMEI